MKTMKTEITALQADITTLPVDAIVNAANSALAGGGGVDGAIHRAGGPQIMAACRRYTSEHGPLPPGQAMITPGGKLPAQRVIHTVGPIWGGGANGEDATLQNCYRASLGLAASQGLRTIAFPAISTGIYGFPADRAARLAVETARTWVDAHPGRLERIVFCCYDARTSALYEAQLGGISRVSVGMAA